MKIVIRNNVFETNSSSTHSVTINPITLIRKLFFLQNDFVFQGDDFDSNTHTAYNDTKTKFQYIVTALFSDCNSGPDFEQILCSREYKMLRKVIKEKTTCKIIVPSVDKIFHDETGKNEWFPRHNLSLGDNGTLKEIFENEEQLISFLFNPHSIVVSVSY